MTILHNEDRPSVFDLPDFSPDLVADLLGAYEQGEGSTFQNAPWEIARQTRYLIGVLRTVNARRVLEIGTHKAGFCYLLKLALPSATIDTFGKESESARCVAILNGRLGDFATFHEGDSKATLPAFVPDSPIDFAWIDGGHDEKTCLSDLRNCDRLRIPHVCVDDYRTEPGVAAAVREILSQGSYEIVDVSEDQRGICRLHRRTTSSAQAGAT
jgi:hypothetical protein